MKGRFLIQFAIEKPKLLTLILVLLTLALGALMCMLCVKMWWR